MSTQPPSRVLRCVPLLLVLLVGHPFAAWWEVRSDATPLKKQIVRTAAPRVATGRVPSGVPGVGGLAAVPVDVPVPAVRTRPAFDVPAVAAPRPAHAHRPDRPRSPPV